MKLTTQEKQDIVDGLDALILNINNDLSTSEDLLEEEIQTSVEAHDINVAIEADRAIINRLTQLKTKILTTKSVDGAKLK